MKCTILFTEQTFESSFQADVLLSGFLSICALVVKQGLFLLALVSQFDSVQELKSCWSEIDVTWYVLCQTLEVIDLGDIWPLPFTLRAIVTFFGT